MRISPNKIYDGYPCSIVSVGCAVEARGGRLTDIPEGLKNNGYLKLEDMNRYIRALLPIQKKEYFKRGERTVLIDFLKRNTRKAVVCLRGHYVYVDGADYWSFFKNEYDEVICVWWIKE